MTSLLQAPGVQSKLEAAWRPDAAQALSPLPVLLAASVGASGLALVQQVLCWSCLLGTPIS